MFSWITTLLSLTGTILNTRKIKEGFLIWIIANFLWVIRFYQIKEHGAMFLFFVYFILAIYGYFHWKKTETS